jgi:beta-galactosidase
MVLTARRETAGAPAALRLTADRMTVHADGEDVAMLSAAIVDAAGRVVPDADNLVAFKVTGPAAIIGVGNGNPASAEADKAAQRKAFNGLCAAILRTGKTPGPLQVEATSPGLAAGTVTLAAAAAPLRPAL